MFCLYEVNLARNGAGAALLWSRIVILIDENVDDGHEKEGGQIALEPSKTSSSRTVVPTLMGRTSALPTTLGTVAKVRKYS